MYSMLNDSYFIMPLYVTGGRAEPVVVEQSVFSYLAFPSTYFVLFLSVWELLCISDSRRGTLPPPAVTSHKS